jgi:hypothetical protein
MADLTTQILIEIRDEIRATNQRLDQVASGLNSRIDKTNTRLDESNTRLVPALFRQEAVGEGGALLVRAA